MKQIEFLIREVEGDIVATSNEQALEVYNTEMNRYFSKRSELYNQANPKQAAHVIETIDDLFVDLDGTPLFDVEAKMIEEGYLYQSLYSYKPEDGENGHGIYETPFAKIESFILDQRLSFAGSDGVCVANKKVVITLK